MGATFFALPFYTHIGNIMPTKDELKTTIGELEEKITSLEEDIESLQEIIDENATDLVEAANDIALLKKGTEDEAPQEEVEMVQLYWPHPVMSLDGTSPTCYSFLLEQDEDGAWSAMVPAYRVADLIDRNPGFIEELVVAEDAE